MINVVMMAISLGVGVIKGVQRKASKSNLDKGGQEKFSVKKRLLTLNSKA